MDCVFCSIIASPDALLVDSDDKSVAFLDINPLQRGHVLVVPRRHVADLTSDAEVLAEVSPLASRIAVLQKERLGAAAVNLLSCAGAAAGQEVFHMHLHLIPRYETLPGLRPLFTASADKHLATADELQAVYDQLVGE